MVTIVGFKEIQTEDGREFVSIELQGEPKLEISATTGNFYLTANKTRVSTAFSAEACKLLIGQKLPGRVEKVQVDMYYLSKKCNIQMITDYYDEKTYNIHIIYAIMLKHNSTEANYSIF
jgi:hypothetical protein